jgi:hypothetical protein
VYTFNIDASHIQMPLNWQVDKVLDADEIATVQFPGVKAAIAAALTAPTGTGTTPIPMDELMKKLINAEVLFASVVNPTTFGTSTVLLPLTTLQ